MNSFSHKRPVRNSAGEIVGMAEAPAVRITNGLGPGGRRLVVSLCHGDLVTVRELRSQKEYSILANDLYWHLLRMESNRVQLEKARERRAKKLAAKAERRAMRIIRGKVTQ